MPARLQNTLHMIGRQIHDWRISQLSSFYSEQRTRLTWARLLKSYDNIPEVYKEFFELCSAKEHTFPYAVLAPAYETPGYRITEKVVCLFDHEIQILERNGKDLTVQCYPLAGISHVEVSSMLLDSRIRINGVTGQGNPSSCMVRFNTASDYLFVPILRKIRLYPATSNDANQNSELESFEQWMHLNYKFMNLARNSLVQGERVLCAILQPEVRRDLVTILGKTYFKTISPTHASILTERELILIREELLPGREDKYGGIWEYIPISKIADLSVSRKNEHWLALSVHLLTNERFECLFQSPRKNDVDQLLDMFKEMKSG